MRGVEKKSIATSDTRFVENIQKNGIRVEINDAYRMYKQYVLFSDAKTPSRRDCSFFFTLAESAVSRTLFLPTRRRG